MEETQLELTGEDGLPVELAGKTPKEIAEYYRRREEILVDQLRTKSQPQAQPTVKDDKDEKIDLFNDPTGSVKRVVDKAVNERVQAVTDAATPAIVNACRIAVRDKYKDYDRFAPEVEKRMRAMNPQAQMNPEYWDFTYKIVKGEQADALVTEAVNRARTPVERPTPPSPEPAKPRDLSADEMDVARKFGMSADQYRTAATRYESEDGRLPLTVDSSKPRKKAS